MHRLLHFFSASFSPFICNLFLQILQVSSISEQSESDEDESQVTEGNIIFMNFDWLLQKWSYKNCTNWKAHNIRLLPALNPFLLICRESVGGIRFRHSVSLRRVLKGLIPSVFSRCGRCWQMLRCSITAHQVLWNPVTHEWDLHTVAKTLSHFAVSLMVLERWTSSRRITM